MGRFTRWGRLGFLVTAGSFLVACGTAGGGAELPRASSGSGQIQVVQRQPPSQTMSFPLLTANAGASGIALGGDSNYWVTEGAVGKVARITDNGTVTEFQLLISRAPSYVTPGTGVNYAVYAVDSTDEAVAEVAPTGSIKEVKLPTGSSPQQAVVDKTGNLWVTEAGTNSLAKIAQNRVVTQYSLPAGSAPYGIALGSDHNLWITEPGIGSIAKVVPSTAAMTQYALPAGRVPTSISGGSTYLYFGESTTTGTAYLARMTTAGILTEYATTSNAIPTFLIASGPLSSPWFCSNGDELTYATITAKKITYTNVTTLPATTPIVAGNDGNVWFADPVNNAADVYVLDPMTVTPTSISFTAVAQTQSFTATETHHTGPFYVSSSNSNVASVSPSSGASFTVTAVNAGTATVTVSDSSSYPKSGNGTTIAVVVTLTSISINAVSRK